MTKNLSIHGIVFFIESTKLVNFYFKYLSVKTQIGNAFFFSYIYAFDMQYLKCTTFSKLH